MHKTPTLKVNKHQEKLKKTTGLPWRLSGKESTCQCRRHEFDPWVGKIPWRRKWQTIPVFLAGESHEQRSLVGYSTWRCKRVWHYLATKQQNKWIAIQDSCIERVHIVRMSNLLNVTHRFNEKWLKSHLNFCRDEYTFNL